MTDFFTGIIDWYMANMNYGTITVCMAIESTFLPLPSEIIVPPAAYKAAQGDLNIYLVIFFSTLGALIGSLINYCLAFFVGRKIIYSLAATRFAKLCMIEPASVEKAENYFVKHGKSSTFIGRLVPAVRHLISIPAGLAKMPIGSFILFTILGAGIWNIILALLGYNIPPSFIDKYFKELSYAMWGLGFLFAAFLIYKTFFTKKKENVTE